MKHKIWMRLFSHIAMIIALFCVLLAVANGTMLRNFFIWQEENKLVEGADIVEQIEDITDNEIVLSKLQNIEDRYSTTVNIYNNNKQLIYSTLRQGFGGRLGFSGFDMLAKSIKRYEITDIRADGENGMFFTSLDLDSGAKYIVYRRAFDEYSVELMVQKSIIENSADTANKFMIIVSSVCLVASLIWSVLFARKFAKPIVEMNEIAVNMSHLDFSLKLIPTSNNEIGQLALSINEMSKSLDLALGELKEKNAKLQDEIELERRLDSMRKGFVANVSHELKTPISIIGGYAEGLISGLGDERKRKKYCEVIKEETERMNKLVINLLELSRYESGIEPNMSAFDLPALFIDIADKNSTKMEEKKVDLQFDFPERQQVFADKLYIEQALQNYLSNAISHVNEGGVIKLSIECYNENVRACVYNSGSQIANDDFENIWQSFYRADKSHNRAAGRYGLGLSIVKAIMLMHKRNFGVFNTDSGVCFWIELAKSDEKA